MHSIHQQEISNTTRKIFIEPITTSAISSVNQLVNSAYRGESSKAGWTTEADLLDGIRTSEESLTAMIELPGGTMLLAKDVEQQLVGCVFLQVQHNKLYLGMLTVDPQKQGLGIGKKLIQAAEQYGITKKCDKVVMTVIDVRHELIAWYRKSGYLPTGEIKPFPNDPAFGIPRQPLQFVVLEKEIVATPN